MNFGQRLKTLRNERGLSQEDLARLTGISARVIGYYESGERFPHTQEALLKIAEVFEVSLDYLLDNPTRTETSCPSRYCYMKTLSSEDCASVNQFVRYLRSISQQKNEVADNLAKAGQATTSTSLLDDELQQLVNKCKP